MSDTLTLALQTAGLEQTPTRRRPRLLSDSRPCHIASEVGERLENHGMSHARGSHYHLPGNLQDRLAALVDYNNRERYHESLDNLTPDDAHFGRGETILGRRAGIKRKTMALRRTLHKKMAA